MKSYLFKVIFTGQLDDTLPVDIIRNKLAKLLNQNHKKVESFLNGKPFLIKKNVDQITAEKFRNTLKKAGAICIIKPEDEKQEETKKDSDNLKVILTKSTCKIVKLDTHRTDFRLSPLTCNLITSTSEGIKIHRPEKEAAKFSEILSVSICSQTGNIEGLQVLLFIKGLIRPVSAKPVNIRFSDFCENTAISSIDSIKQFINYLYNKSPDLIIDKNTYEFILSKGGRLPKEDPIRLATAMGDILNPGKKKPADLTKAPFLKTQDFKKVGNKSSELAYHGRIQDQEKSETDLSLQKAKQKRVLHLFAGLLVILLLGGASYMFWDGYDKRVRTDALPRVVKVEQDLMLSQLYLLYDSIPIEVQDSDAIKRCNNNILQLIDLSKIIIRYLDKNKMYWGDEYIITRNDAILGPLAKIQLFEHELFKISLEDKIVEIENHYRMPSNVMEQAILFEKMTIFGFMKNNLTQMWFNPHYVKMPKDRLSSKLEKYSAHGWPVVKTIDNLRMKFSYSYGSIQKEENISDEIHSSFPNPLVKEKLSMPIK